MGFSRVLAGVHQPPAGLLQLSLAAWGGSVHLVAAASQVAGWRHVLPWPRVCPPTQAMRGLGGLGGQSKDTLSWLPPTATWGAPGWACLWAPMVAIPPLTLPTSSGSALWRGKPCQTPSGLCLPTCELLCSSGPVVNICRFDAKWKFKHSQQLEGSLD